MSILRLPKTQLLLILAVLLAIAAPSAGGISLMQLAAALVPGMILDGAWLSIQARRARFPSSALLTGLFIFLVLSPGESWLVCVWASAFATLMKRFVRTGREHIFNPAALALVCVSIFFGSGESWWGALAEVSWLWILVMIAAGAYLIDRLNKFPLVLTFLGTYFLGLGLSAMVNPIAVAELFRAPFLQAAVFVALFMITDPPTSPNHYRDQIWIGIVVALASVGAQLVGAGQIYLLLGLLAGDLSLSASRIWLRRARTPKGSRPNSLTPVVRRLAHKPGDGESRAIAESPSPPRMSPAGG
jgi:Na+-translocating ferredoxin:NAD+ oxidoreductase RnfD subunit